MLARFKKSLLPVVIMVLVLVFIVCPVLDSIFHVSPMIFSRFHFLDENKVGAQVVYGEEINKYTLWRGDKQIYSGSLGRS